MVTFLSATVRATPARNAVRPARAPDDRSRPASGAFTEAEVMLTMRPNLRCVIGSITFWISSIATIMLAITPSIICWRVSSRKSRNGGPALLLIRMSGSGQAANSAFWPGRRRHVGDYRDDLGPGLLGKFGGGGVERLGVAAVDHDLAAGCASARAQALPSPRLEAQTMALRPAIPRSMAGPHWRDASFAASVGGGQAGRQGRGGPVSGAAQRASGALQNRTVTNSESGTVRISGAPFRFASCCAPSGTRRTTSRPWPRCRRK